MDPSGEAPILRRAGGLPWGMICAIGLVATIESTLARHDLDITTVLQWDWRAAARAAAGEAPGNDILCFGDSLSKFGVMPRIIEDRTGRRAYSLAIHVGQVPNSYFLFRRCLEAGATPSAVVLDSTTHLLAPGPDYNLRNWPEMLTARECLEMAWAKRDLDFFTRTMLAELLPSYKERFEIRKSVFAAMNNRSGSLRADILPKARNWQENRGAQLLHDTPVPVFDADHFVRGHYPQWGCDPVNEKYLRKFMKLAESRKIRVYWLLPPVHPAVTQRLERSGYAAEYTRFVRKYQARFPSMVVLDARGAIQAPENYYDAVHLDRPGALLLSSGVADALKGPVAGSPMGPNWVELKVDPARPVGPPLEDIVESGVALQRLEPRVIR